MELDRKDLSSLAQANVENRFPELRHLDISSNNLNRNESLNSLFDYSCKWNKLLTLNIVHTMCSHDELHRRAQSGCLSSLQELRVSEYPQQEINIVWPYLQIPGVDYPNDEVLWNIANAVGGSLAVACSHALGYEPLVTGDLAMGLTIGSSHKQELSSVYQFIDVLYSLCIYEALRH